MIGLHRVNLQQAIAQKRVTPPRLTTVGGVRIRLWNRQDVERARKQLSKIKDGRRRRKKK